MPVCTNQRLRSLWRTLFILFCIGLIPFGLSIKPIIVCLSVQINCPNYFWIMFSIGCVTVLIGICSCCIRCYLACCSWSNQREETTTHYRIQKLEYLRLQRLFQPPPRPQQGVRHPPCGSREQQQQQQQQQQQRVRSSPQGRAQKEKRSQKRARPKQKKHPARPPPYSLPQQQQYQQPPPYSVPQDQQSHPPENPPPYDLLAFEDEHRPNTSGVECYESLPQPSAREGHSAILNHQAWTVPGSPDDPTFDSDIENNLNMVLEQIEESRC